jgi:hypothetical protein
MNNDNMPDFFQQYQFNSLSVCVLLFIYNIWKSNYEYIYLLWNKLILLDYTSLIIIINIIGIYLFLKNLTFEINIHFTIKHNYTL